MKILVIQLARLGDIYMSWPAMRALRRMHPQAEIHLLTRPRFEGAIEGLNAVDRHWSFSSSSILAPLVQKDADFESSFNVIDSLIQDLRTVKFDKVINLTFSPLSSFVTYAISGPEAEVFGYSRYADGSLRLSDEMSAYFYAQVGVGGSNRVHLADIFASLLDIQYVESDWEAPPIAEVSVTLPNQYVVVHVGASEKHKRLSANTWKKILTEYSRSETSLPLVMIGSSEESSVIQEIIGELQGLDVYNLAGKTKISDLFSIIGEADLLVGGDSAPIHMASLTDTPTFNISVGAVNFWETGPKASLSFIYRMPLEEDSHGVKIGAAIKGLLNGELSPDLITRGAGHVSYQMHENSQQRFAWDFVQALYLGHAYPLAERMETLKGVTQLNEINIFAMEQVELISSKGLERVGPFIDRAEEVIHSIGRCVPELVPLINWYQAEKVRIGPGSLAEMQAATLGVHKKLAQHLKPYIPHEDMLKEKVIDGTI